MSCDQALAISLCRVLSPIFQKYGAHIALTGGCLFKEGPRKDIDLLIYRIRQIEKIDFDGLIQELKSMGIKHTTDHGFCKKFEWIGGRVKIDLLYPEHQESGDYENHK